MIQKKGKYYRRFYNIPCALDIECSSFYDDVGNKVGLMYVWQICINGYCWLGRTYKQFYDMLEVVHEVLKTGYCKTLVFYVHNLQYEFNALRHYLDVVDYFAIDNRTPLYVQDRRGIVFRCSYQLSGYSLRYLGDNVLTRYKVSKGAAEDINYYLIRSPETPLTRKAIGYCVNDVRVVVNYIQELMEDGEDLAHMPLTKTGRVRSALIEGCINTDDGKLNRNYIKLMKTCSVEVDEYKLLRQAFAGGFTHSNPFNSNKHFREEDGKTVIPFDINSAYIWAMLNKFPTGRPYKLPSLDLAKYRELYDDFNIVSRFRFTGLRSVFPWDYYISKSKCQDLTGEVVSNGRVSSSLTCEMVITELDFKIIEQTYIWDSVEISDVLIYTSEYLPKEFMSTVLDFYEKKTTLKHVPGREIEYAKNKELLNSTYGCQATDVCRPLYTYNGDYGVELPDVADSLARYNKRMTRTSTYAWAPFITAYCRYKLWTEAIIPRGALYVYSDTDSIYTLYDDDVERHFQEVNDNVVNYLKEYAELQNIPFDRLAPFDKYGERQPLGIWSREDTCVEFKTLGAKRYLKTTIKNGNRKYSSTIAGLSKNAINYIMDHGGYDYFDKGMTVPSSDSGRLAVTYIDDRRKGTAVDYTGRRFEYDVKCGVHMEPCDFTLSSVKLFLEFLKSFT